MTSIWQRSGLAAVFAAALCATLVFAANPSVSVFSVTFLMLGANRFQVALIIGLGLVSVAAHRRADRSTRGRWMAILLSIALAFGGLTISHAVQTLELEPSRLWWWDALLRSMALAEASLFLTLALIGIAASSAVAGIAQAHEREG